MSDPYGGGGYQPYEPRQDPYGAEEPGALPPPAPRATGGTDGISIAALVCSLTCFGAPIGIGLGIAGLVRTKGGQRSGRWAAVTGLVVGVVVALCGIGFFTFAAIMGSRTLWEDEARVGDCVDLSTFLTDEVDLIKASCEEPHDAEVFWAGQFDLTLLRAWREASSTDFCAAQPISSTYAALIGSGDYTVGMSNNGTDHEDPDEGDWFVCYLEPKDGRLDAPLGESAAG